MTGAPAPHSPRILLVEDDPAISLVITESLGEAGYAIDRVASIAERDAWLMANQPDLVITDVVLPDGDALDKVAPFQRSGVPIIVLSAQNSLDTAVRAESVGSFDYLPKPFDLGELTGCVNAALARARAGDSETGGAGAAVASHGLVGSAAPMQAVYRTIARLVANDLAVLILGESGTGKELVARAIHGTGRRKDRQFVAINMAAIPRDLIEAELFGHEKGSFTGAVGRGIGRFEQANGGTLFLDEIGDMPIDAQTRLLRVLQSGDFSRVGGRETLHTDVRVIAATHRNLQELVDAGQFRSDLYFRLNVIPVTLPALRERRSDIAALADYFMAQGRADGLPEKQFGADAYRALMAYDWPGNVRELGNVVQRLSVLVRDSQITAEDVQGILGQRPGGNITGSTGLEISPQEKLEQAVAALVAALIEARPDREDLHRAVSEPVERQLLDMVLRASGGNQLASARRLGLNRNTLRKRLDQFGLLDRA